jgi:hypothetical protein
MAVPSGITLNEDTSIPKGITLSGTAPAGITLNTPKKEAFVPEEITVGGVASEFARGANTSVAEMLDFLSVGTINAGLRLAGSDTQLPTFMDGFRAIEDAVYGNDDQETQRQFMPSGTARDITKAAGMAATTAPGFMSVKRAATTGNYALDWLGLGSTVTDDVARELTEQGVKIAKSRSADWHKLGDDFLETDEDIYRMANLAGKRDVIEKNRVFMATHQDVMDKIVKEQGPAYKPTDMIVTQHTIPESHIKPSLTRVVEDLDEIYGVSPKKTLEVLKKKGGLKVDTDPLALRTVDKQFKQENLREGIDVSWWEHIASPMTETLRRHVGANVAGHWERAVETATRKQARVAAEIGEPIKDIAKLADDNETFKAVLLDFHRSPVQKMAEARKMIQENLGDEAVKSFDTFIKQAGKQATAGRKHLYKPDSGFDDIYYLHSSKKAKKRKGWVQKPVDPHTSKPGALKARGRKAGWDMEVDELAEYANPILTHLKHMSDEEALIEVAKKFKLSPTMGKGGTTLDLFKGVEAKLVADGIDPERAKLANDLMHGAQQGATKIPPPAVRAFMAMGYAGTLAQFKSAMLNLHDVFVSMTNNGIKPTMKALMQTTNGAFGKTLKNMGIGDDQSVGEFVKQFDDTISNPGKWDKVADKASKVTQFSFRWSGFAAMDRIGKGVVLRSALNKARDAARKGELVKEWGHMLSTQELQRVRKHLAGTQKVEDMPLHVRRLIEEASFSKLGEQQLISMAGRPLAYANNTFARPLYAMTGFAIKQKAMFRKNFLDELHKGNIKEAASYAARYTLFAGLGYGLIDETRGTVFKGEDFHAEDILFGALEQMASVATLNRVGDTYTFHKLADDAPAFLLESVLPPMGLVGAMGKTASNMILNGVWDDEIARKFPIIGDFYNYYWFPRQGKAGRDKQTKVGEAYEVFKSYGED